MLTKILFTLLVIIGAIVYIRWRTSKRELAPVVYPASRPTVRARPRLVFYISLGLLFVMLIATGAYLLQMWLDDARIIRVQVINSNTGAVISYEVRKGDMVAGKSTFHTIDGRSITLAAVERLEIGGEE